MRPPSDVPVTEPSPKTSRIAAAIVGAIDRISRRSQRFSCGIGRESVTNNLVDEIGLQDFGGGVREHRVGRRYDNSLSSRVLERLGGLDDGSPGVNKVIDNQTDATFDPHRRGRCPPRPGSRNRRMTTLVNESREASVSFRSRCSAYTQRDPMFGLYHGQSGRIELRATVFQQKWHREQVVKRSVKNPWNLGRVDINRHDAIGSSGLEEVSDEACGNRLTSAALSVWRA